jgi:molybdopterin-guanine dinucleotide biosynthesis protein A
MENLFGLVVCGGSSSRMGIDKSLLRYYDQPQRYHLYDLLKTCCERVFISCNREQANDIPPRFECIVDEEKYSGIGPMAAMLSAFQNFPGASFLAVGCDYPFIRQKDLLDLVEGRMGLEQAVCYYNTQSGMEEPMLSIYEKECYPALLQNFHSKKYSLRHFLKEANTCLVLPDSNDILESVNDRETFVKVKELINARLN